MDTNRVIHQLSDLNPEAIFFDNMDSALVGVGYVGSGEPVAVYSKMKLLDCLRAAGLPQEDVEEYYVSHFVARNPNPNAPIVLDELQED
jgi:hypothetical protein